MFSFVPERDLMFVFFVLEKRLKCVSLFVLKTNLNVIQFCLIKNSNVIWFLFN